MNAVALLACSGPAAPGLISEAIRLGWILFAVSVAIAGAGILIARWSSGGRWSRLPLIALFVHPGWYCSAQMGDCGSTLRTGAIAGTGLMVLAALGGVWRARRPPPPPPPADQL